MPRKLGRGRRAGREGWPAFQNAAFQGTLPQENTLRPGGPGRRMKAALLHTDGRPCRVKVTPLVYTAFPCRDLFASFSDTFPLKMGGLSYCSPDSRGHPALP